ncbi:cystatin-like fold lipoprotein [Bacillus pacificus]|nr:cystatin-like fold lipoprotein [Bacillus pacificus]
MRKNVVLAIVMFVSAATLFSGCTNKYDKEIDKVISLETVEIKDAKKDIKKVERKNTCTKVFRDGGLIQIEYQIRKGDSIKSYYKKVKGNYEWVTYSGAGFKDNEEPVYTENCD